MTILSAYGIINTESEGIEMWMIFDADGDFVGMVSEDARHNTNILQVLEEANYTVNFVSHIGSLRSYKL